LCLAGVSQAPSFQPYQQGYPSTSSSYSSGIYLLFFLPSDLENQDNQNHIILMANLFCRWAFPEAEFNNLPTIILLQGTPATAVSAAAAAPAVSTSRAVGVAF